MSKQKSNVRKLFDSIDKLAGKISTDLDLIAEGKNNPDGSEVEFSSKFVDTFLKMVDKIDKIKNFNDVYESIDGTITTIETKTETVEKRNINMFEEIQNKVKNKPQDGLA